MIRGLIGSGTIVSQLKQGLGESTVRARDIAHRVANASNERVASFEEAFQVARGDAEGVDLESEMVRLADEQLRFDTVSRVLNRTYGQIRSTMRSQ